MTLRFFFSFKAPGLPIESLKISTQFWSEKKKFFEASLISFGILSLFTRAWPQKINSSKPVHTSKLIRIINVFKQVFFLYVLSIYWNLHFFPPQLRLTLVIRPGTSRIWVVCLGSWPHRPTYRLLLTSHHDYWRLRLWPLWGRAA